MATLRPWRHRPDAYAFLIRLVTALLFSFIILWGAILPGARRLVHVLKWYCQDLLDWRAFHSGLATRTTLDPERLQEVLHLRLWLTMTYIRRELESWYGVLECHTAELHLKLMIRVINPYASPSRRRYRLRRCSDFFFARRSGVKDLILFDFRGWHFVEHVEFIEDMASSNIYLLFLSVNTRLS